MSSNDSDSSWWFWIILIGIVWFLNSDGCKATIGDKEIEIKSTDAEEVTESEPKSKEKKEIKKKPESGFDSPEDIEGNRF